MKRLGVAALIAALAVPLAAQGARADIMHATGVTTSSKGWIVTLSIAKWSMRAGSSMTATLTIFNRTGHDVKVIGCRADADFTVGIGNAKVPYQAFSTAMPCSTTLKKGRNVIHDVIRATYSQCSGSGGPLACGPGGAMPNLPAGIYHTVVEWPSSPPFVRHPGTLTVTVMK